MSSNNIYRPGEAPIPNPTKGTELMEGLLLNQYKDKPILKQYMSAFIEELDLLFEETEKVYLGRFLENAVGQQLDIIGIILDQLRNIELPKVWFGFQGALDVDRMADEATPGDGGLFRDEFLEGFETFPLDDETYRRVLLAKALLINASSMGVNTVYTSISIIIGYVPQLMNLITIADRRVELQISAVDTTNTDSALINYMSKYFVPMGTTFSVLRV